MRRFIIICFVIASSAAAALAADLPGRVSFGFNVGGCHSANDHERWSASGTGYGYSGEVAYEPTSWLVAPQMQWGYTYASGDVPPWEAAGYFGNPTELRAEGDTFFVGGRARVPLWQMKLRPYAGGGVAWTNYDRIVRENSRVLSDKSSFGTGWAALGGVEFFPAPASGFSVALEYRYAATTQEWRQPPAGGTKGPFEAQFRLTETLATLGVKIYVL